MRPQDFSIKSQAEPTPQEQSKELEYEIEKTLADCPINQAYDSVLRRCVEIIQEVEEIQPMPEAAPEAEVLIEEPQPEQTFIEMAIPRAPIQEQLGPKYYDWANKVWRNCNVGEVYSYPKKACLPKVEQPRRQFWSSLWG